MIHAPSLSVYLARPVWLSKCIYIYVGVYVQIYGGPQQSWESYFIKVIYYILLFTFAKSNALQLHVT